MTSMYMGLLLCILAGVLSGCCVLPMKFAQRWKWENFWVMGNGLALVVIPALLFAFTMPVSPRTIYLGSNQNSFLIAVVFGAGWGVGATLCGLAYTMLGLGLGMSIVLGLSSVVGALLPLLAAPHTGIPASSTARVLLGLAVMVTGLIFSARAGTLRQSTRADEVTKTADLKAFGKGDIKVGLILAILSGLLSSMFNLALFFGEGIRVSALAHGVTPFAAANALSLPLTVSGFLAILIYCTSLMVRNRTYRLFFAPSTGSHWLLAFTTATLYIGSIVVYAMAMSLIGSAGAAIGFPIYMATMILTGNLAGLFTGEWKNAPRSAYYFGTAGMLVLIAAIVIIAASRTES